MLPNDEFRKKKEVPEFLAAFRFSNGRTPVICAIAPSSACAMTRSLPR
jgi:hypothetical protein